MWCARGIVVARLSHPPRAVRVAELRPTYVDVVPFLLEGMLRLLDGREGAQPGRLPPSACLGGLRTQAYSFRVFANPACGTLGSHTFSYALSRHVVQ